MLVLPDALRDAIRAHAQRDYPLECVGALYGTWDFASGVRRASQILPLTNASPEPRRAFSLSSADLLNAFVHHEKRTGLTFVGIYHSHPDCPARPSATDRRECRIECSFVIASVVAGAMVELTSWVLDPDGGSFAPEPIERTDR